MPVCSEGRATVVQQRCMILSSFDDLWGLRLLLLLWLMLQLLLLLLLLLLPLPLLLLLLLVVVVVAATVHRRHLSCANWASGATLKVCNRPLCEA